MDRENEIRHLLAKLDDTICFREKAVTPEDRVEGIDSVDRIKAKIIAFL